MNEVIVIAANEYMALGQIKSLGQANYHTKLIALSRRTFEVAGRSKYVTARVFCREKADEILKALNDFRLPDKKILIFPAYDRAVKMLDQNMDQLKTSFYFPNIDNSGGNMVHYMNKEVQKQMAKSCGLDVANGRGFLTDAENDQTTAGVVSYPCFVKPLGSAFVDKYSKRLFRKCDNPDELKQALAVARNHPCKEVLIEDYLEIDHELCAYGVAADTQVCIPACVVTERPGKLGHAGVASEGKVLSAEMLGSVKEKLLRLVRDLRLTGLFCIDLIVSHGTVYFSEINLRAGGSGYGVTLAGINMPAMLADAVYNGTAIEQCYIKNEVRFINERVEADLFVDGFLSMSELKKAFAGNRKCFIKDPADPVPWRLFKLAATMKWFKKNRKRHR